MSEQNPFYVEVGERIRRARKKRKMTQEDLADAVSLTRTSITNVEHGRQKVPLHTFAAIAESLQVEVSSLLPDVKENGNESLRQALSKRPESERKWIETAVRSVAQKEATR